MGTTSLVRVSIHEALRKRMPGDWHEEYSNGEYQFGSFTISIFTIGKCYYSSNRKNLRDSSECVSFTSFGSSVVDNGTVAPGSSWFLLVSEPIDKSSSLAGFPFCFLGLPFRFRVFASGLGVVGALGAFLAAIVRFVAIVRFAGVVCFAGVVRFASGVCSTGSAVASLDGIRFDSESPSNARMVVDRRNCLLGRRRVGRTVLVPRGSGELGFWRLRWSWRALCQ
jgi:hypothetical protein